MNFDAILIAPFGGEKEKLWSTYKSVCVVIIINAELYHMYVEVHVRNE